MFNEFDMPCQKTVPDLINTTYLPSVRSVPIKVDDTSGHISERTPIPEIVLGPKIETPLQKLHQVRELKFCT